MARTAAGIVLGLPLTGTRPAEGGGEGMDPSSFNEQLPPFGLDEFEKSVRAAEVQLAW